MKIYKAQYSEVKTGKESFERYFRKFEDVYNQVRKNKSALNSKNELLIQMADIGIAFPEVCKTTAKYSGIEFYVSSITEEELEW